MTSGQMRSGQMRSGRTKRTAGMQHGTPANHQRKLGTFSKATADSQGTGTHWQGTEAPASPPLIHPCGHPGPLNPGHYEKTLPTKGTPRAVFLEGSGPPKGLKGTENLVLRFTGLTHLTLYRVNPLNGLELAFRGALLVGHVG